MNLSKSFTLAELCVTNTGIPNVPDAQELENLERLANDVLQPIRDAWGAIVVNSGFRCRAVNMAIGGASTSEHQDGNAADIKPTQAPIEVVFDWIVKKMQYGQAILEDKNGVKWIHISRPRAQRTQQAMTAKLVNGKMRYFLYEGIA